MKARCYVLRGSVNDMYRWEQEYKSLGFHTFYREGDLVVSPWPKPKPVKTEEEAKKRLVSKRERNFGHARD